MTILQGRQTTIISSGGYPGEEHGATGGSIGESWVNVPDSGSSTSTYYYRDSYELDNNRSSKVSVVIQDSWRIVSVSENNFVTIETTTKILSINRGDLRGSTSGTRNIYIRQEPGGSNIWSTIGDNVAVAHSIAGEINVGTYRYTIPPLSEWGRTTVYYRSNVSGHDSDPVPNIYTDEMWIGIGLKNTLPPDYRSGKIWNGSAWLSHNRSGGADDIYTGSAWRTMRTVNGATASDNPPLIRHSNNWYNQRRIGQE